MRRTQYPLRFALVVAIALAAGATWMLWGGWRGGTNVRPPVAVDNATPRDPSALSTDERKDYRRSTSGTGENPRSPDDDGKDTIDAGQSEDEKFPEGPYDSPWDPTAFRNNRFVWQAPAAQTTAKVLLHTDGTSYEGTPTFLYGSDAAFLRSTGYFDPGTPDGMLVIQPGTYEPKDLRGWLADGTLTATAPNGDTLYRMPTNNGFNWFAIPYSYERTEVIGLKVTGPGILPAEAVVSQLGMPGEDLRRGIILEGRALSVSFRLFPADYTDFRSVVALNENGLPVRDAMLVHGAQIFGHSNASGALRFPWPGPLDYGESPGKIREKFFFVSAPGYVPVLLERSALENAAGPVEVTLKARELLVSVYETVPRPEVLKLGANVDRQSAILDAGLDLFPVPDDWPEFQEWTDVQRAIGYGFHPERYETHRANGKLQDYHPYDVIRFYQTKGTGPYEPGHEFGGDGARKLADALGRRATEHWPEYARWYYGRWDYDEREGRFDVVLPFAGRFLLAVGEYNHGPKGDERNGGLTHVLYIDARNPARLQSKLLIHPQG